jgi:hypothetical protein
MLNNAKNTVNVVNQLNDNTYFALNNANTVVSQLRDKLDDASGKLGVAKFNLQQILNNLFFSQSSKKQAYKVIALVRAQTYVVSADDSNSTYIFGECLQ